MLRERKPLPTPKISTKRLVIWDSSLNCRINPYPDLDVCRISPKMLWIHYLFGVSHLAKFRKNLAVTVGEMLINLKFPVCNGEENRKVVRYPHLGPEPHQK